jgi:hypothetical protein
MNELDIKDLSYKDQLFKPRYFCYFLYFCKNHNTSAGDFFQNVKKAKNRPTLPYTQSVLNKKKRQVPNTVQYSTQFSLDFFAKISLHLRNFMEL